MWQCQKCHEQVEDSFEVCWSCGTSKDGQEDRSFRRADEGEAEMADAGPSVPPAAQSAAAPARTRPRPTSSVCPKCGAQRVIPGVRVLDRDGDSSTKDLSVRLDRNPSAWIFKGSEVVELTAKVCGRCGYAELYAADPAALWSAYQEQTQAESDAEADRPGD
jgi:hypothetical protein